MYLRAIHAEQKLRPLLDFIHHNPLGLFTTAIPSPSHPLLQSSHVPWVLESTSSSEDPTSPGIKGRLHGHMARQNPQVKAILEALSSTDTDTLEQEVLIIFTGDTHYVTPKFYKETKPQTGKVVPTWNYSAVQVYGKARIYHTASAATSEYLGRQMNDLTTLCEKGIMGFNGEKGTKQGAWEVGDAPERYLEIMKRGVIGIEVEIERIGGKWKMSQEMGVGDREGVAEGFEGLESEVAGRIAECVREKGRECDEAKARAKELSS
ncbi:hypothetical protein TWF481_008780 [Arthrobotrys musiformis]|uniref:Transcriptional regulator n=1 Tax=Arthrobotrys musiformis TaxID=47236 RepID=A0AAV9W9Y4_9PEZI